jgi:hypothetical protein
MEMTAPATQVNPITFNDIKPSIPLILFGKNGSNPIPVIEKLWDFYSYKGIKTVLVSLGTSSSPLGELEIAETLGCHLHVVEPNEEKRNLWSKVSQILKDRRESEENKCDFTKDVVNKWVLPKNIKISSKLPFFFSGVIDSIETIQIQNFVTSICENMNISNDNARIDFLNVQLGNNLEESVIYSLINSSYRPGMICINYTNKPDSNLITTQLAGHLQNIGYMLIAKEENKFLYVYNDKNIYEFASYENMSVDNPLMYEIIKSTGFYGTCFENKTSQKNIDA